MLGNLYTSLGLVEHSVEDNECETGEHDTYADSDEDEPCFAFSEVVDLYFWEWRFKNDRKGVEEDEEDAKVERCIYC